MEFPQIYLIQLFCVNSWFHYNINSWFHYNINSWFYNINSWFHYNINSWFHYNINSWFHYNINSCFYQVPCSRDCNCTNNKQTNKQTNRLNNNISHFRNVFYFLVQNGFAILPVSFTTHSGHKTIRIHRTNSTDSSFKIR